MLISFLFCISLGSNNLSPLIASFKICLSISFKMSDFTISWSKYLCYILSFKLLLKCYKTQDPISKMASQSIVSISHPLLTSRSKIYWSLLLSASLSNPSLFWHLFTSAPFEKIYSRHLNF